MAYENQETRRAKERIAKIVRRGLEEAGAVAPADVYDRPLNAEKKAPIELMDIPNVAVSDADVLKYGRRMAQMLAADRQKERLI